MDYTAIMIVLLVLVVFICERKGFRAQERVVQEYFYNKNNKNFCNFQPLDSKPPMPSPYQCILNFGCTKGQPSDKLGNVCKTCTGVNWKDKLVMARDVGRVRKLSKLW